MRSGSLCIGSGPELDAAWEAIGTAFQSGDHSGGLSAQRDVLTDALDRAAQTPEGILFLAYRPSLKRLLADHRRRSDQSHGNATHRQSGRGARRDRHDQDALGDYA